MSNPYAQVALTYIRRPFTSWRGWLTTILFVFLPIPLVLRSIVRTFIEIPSVPVAPLLIPFLFLFAFLAIHIKGQFADPRAHLIPGYRRVHIRVAVIAALLAAVVLPSVLTCVLSWHLRHDSPLAMALKDLTDEDLWTITHASRATLQASLAAFDSIGLVAVAIFLFGLAMWVTLIDAKWTISALMAAWVVMLGADSGIVRFRLFIFGQYEQAAVLGLGALMTVLAFIRLLRLNEETLGYHSSTLWGQERTRMTGQSTGQQKRILPGLSDWMRERELTRLVRHARRASQSWWSRTCRWQAGMVVGWPFWFWILGTLVFLHVLTQWVLTPKDPMAAVMYMPAILMFLPAMIAASYVFQWGPFKLGSDFSLPVERSSYLRQVGMAAALNHFQLWGGMSAALVIWWLLVAPRPIPPSMLAGMLAISAAYQVGVFGAVAWTARYRSWQLVGFAMAVLFLSAQCLQGPWAVHWADSQPGGPPYESLWIAGIMAVFGLVATYDAYRRWLAADID